MSSAPNPAHTLGTKSAMKIATTARNAFLPKAESSCARWFVPDAGHVDRELFGERRHHRFAVGCPVDQVDFRRQRRQRQRSAACQPDQRVEPRIARRQRNESGQS